MNTDVTAKRVLIAEDNLGLARVLAFNLKRLGLDVTVTHSGADAWEEVQASEFDLLITDHEMPRMTGLELCELLRSDDRFQSLPIIMITARELELESKHLKERLALSEILAKPYSPSKLQERVQNVLNAAPTS